MNRADAEALDAHDPLAHFREAFELPTGVIYLDGNSLGPLPRATPARLDAVVRGEWGQGLIRSWNSAGWLEAPQRVGGKIARLIGAAPHEVVAADSTSVNLFKLAAAALALDAGRRTLLIPAGDFPTDRYVLEGLAGLSGARLRVVPPDELITAIDAETAAVVLTHVHYRSSRRWDLAGVTAAAHAKGALVIWDLSHTAGALAIDLAAVDADLAVGCGYKYLNGGPGAPAFLYAAERLHGRLKSPLSGWMGHAEPFAFADSYRPAGDIRALLCGTPPILGLVALEAGVDVLLDAGPAAIEAKGLSLSHLFLERVEARCPELTLATPRDPAARGLHVSFEHRRGYAIVQALIARGVIGDYREPDILRFGFPPLFLSHAEVWDAVEVLHEVMASRTYEREEFQARAAVT